MRPGTLELFAKLGIAPDAFAADIAGLGVEGGVMRYGTETTRPDLDPRRDELGDDGGRGGNGRGSLDARKDDRKRGHRLGP